MTMPLLIGVSGPANAGKDTAADHLVERLSKGLRVEKCSFATPLKEICKYVFDMSPDDIEDRETKEQVGRNTYGMTHRKIMQLVGTESFREVINEDIWVDTVSRHTEKKGLDIAVFSDVRFDNEAEWILRNGLLVIVDRPSAVTTAETGHASEAGLSVIPDFKVENSGTLQDYYGMLDLIAAHTIKSVYGEIEKAKASVSRAILEDLREKKKQFIHESKSN